jgi:Rieske Fe-S protein
MLDVDKPECSECKCRPPETVDRRGVLARLLGLAGGIFGLSLLSGCPGGSSYGKKDASTDASAKTADPPNGRLEWDKQSLPAGIASEFKVNGKPAYLLQSVIRNQITFTALMRRCPHSGCTVNFIYTKKKLECPCHGSVFDAEGKVVKGPAKANLTSLSVREEAGKIIVEVPGAYLATHGVIVQR